MNLFLNIITILFVLFLLILLFSYIIVQGFFVRKKDQDEIPVGAPTKEEEDPYYKHRLECIEGCKFFEETDKKEVSIESFDGLRLQGYLFAPEIPYDRTIICVHGYRSNAAKEYGSRLKFLLDNSMNILLVDDRAHGKSEGKYIGFSNLDSRDVLSWCDFINDRFGIDKKIILHGVSMGSASVLAASGDENIPSNVVGVIADCGFSSGWEEASFQLKTWLHLPKIPFQYIAGAWLKILAHYDLRDRAPIDMIPNFKGKLLIIHGDADDFVPTWMSEKIFEAATCEKKLVLIKGAIHANSYAQDKETYQREFLEFLEDV